MATTKEIMVHGVMTQVTDLDSSAQEVDDAVAKSVWASNENLIINWYLADPINQRGQTEYTGAVYGIDCWRGSNVGNKITLTSEGAVLSGKAYAYFLQTIENPEQLSNKTITISAIVKNPYGAFRIAVYNNTTNIAKGTDIPASNDFTLIKFTTSITASAGDFLRFLLYPGSSDAEDARTATVLAAKLELGPVQTLAHQDEDGNWVPNDPPPDKALELAKCHWRYQSMPNWAGGPVIYPGTNYTDVLWCGPPMRTAGTLINPSLFGGATSGTFVEHPESISYQHRLRLFGVTGKNIGDWIEVSGYGCGISSDF